MTTVAIIGAHGQIARMLTRRLRELGVDVAGIIRSPGQTADLEADGALPIVLDIESVTAAELAAGIGQVDAIVFAAGGGPSSGPERKATVDRDGAIKMAQAAEQLGVRRVIQISFHGADQPVDASRGEAWVAYHEAKRVADDYLRETTLDWLILRPSALHDAPAGGIRLVPDDAGRGSSSRELVAEVIAIALTSPDSYPVRAVFGMLDGDGDVEDTLREAASSA